MAHANEVEAHQPGRMGQELRNGTQAKIVLTEIGPVQTEVPVTGMAFDPVFVRKRQRGLDGIDQIVLSLSRAV